MISPQETLRALAQAAVGGDKEAQRKLGDLGFYIPPFPATAQVEQTCKCAKTVAGLVEAVTLPRNTRYEASKVFEGEWVVIPKEDFDKARKALSSYEELGRGITWRTPRKVSTMG